MHGCVTTCRMEHVHFAKAYHDIVSVVIAHADDAVDSTAEIAVPPASNQSQGE